MANNEEKEGTKVPIQVRVDPQVKAIVEKLADRESRSFSNMTDRLLATHPAVEAEAEVAA